MSLGISGTIVAADGYTISPLMVTVADEFGTAAAAFHRIASELTIHHLDLGRRGVAVCGASSGTGVTLTTANLAVALSQRGVRTLLIEADLRRPSLSTLITPPRPSPGLRQMLEDEANEGDALHLDVLPNLAILFGGGSAAAADRLIASARCRDILQTSLRGYDCVLVDTPPSNRSTDACVIASVLGYAVVIGRKRYSYLDDVTMLAGQLAQDGVEVLGTIFNAA